MLSDWIRKLKSLSLGLPGSPTVHPEKFNDPVALLCGWQCLKQGSANFTTHRLIHTSGNNLEYRSSLLMKIFGIPFIIIGLALPALYFFVINRHFIMLVIGPVFALIGISLVVQSMIPIGFDSRKRAYYRGWKQRKIELMTDLRCGVLFEQIHTIQLLKKIGHVSSSSENYHGDSYFYAYELNLILNDGSRRYVMSYINMDQALTDANEISKLVGIPVWNAI